MNQTLVKSLVLSEPLPLTAHPAAVYLRSLGAGSKPTMTTALNAISRSEALRDRFSTQ